MDNHVELEALSLVGSIRIRFGVKTYAKDAPTVDFTIEAESSGLELDDLATQRDAIAQAQREAPIRAAQIKRLYEHYLSLDPEVILHLDPATGEIRVPQDQKLADEFEGAPEVREVYPEALPVPDEDEVAF